MKRSEILLNELLKEEEELLEEFDEKFKELQEVLLEERKEINNRKKWRNVATYNAAKKWLKQNFPPEFIPVWSECGKSEMDTTVSLLVATWLLTNAKNSAVRAAVHHNFIGAATLLEQDTDDGCPYYDRDGDYLGRGQIRYATYRPDCSSEVDYGFAVIAEITPLDNDWSYGNGYAEIAEEMKKLR